VRGDSNCKEFRSRRHSPGERKVVAFWSKSGEVAAWRRLRANNRRKADGGERFECLLGGRACTNRRRWCWGVFGGCCAEIESEERIGRWCPVQLGCHAERKGGTWPR
jgi:hypothetical protein